ncbi:MFS transporter [Gaiella sp.]|uniref:MFS transporter n=1 Tax=Gaiella sp. TaxID=2663207 RepID=UPI0032663580
MEASHPTDAAHRVRILTLFATALGSALAFLDTTVVIVALPAMDDDIGLGLSGQQWVYLAYALSLSAFYLVGGAIGDRVGLRHTFIVGVVLFAVASLLTALAPSEGVLIGGRALQGVGGAVLTTTSLALLRVTWAGQAGRAIGLWTALTSLATVGGPLLGGVIVQTVSWRFVFLINVPLAVVTVVLAVAGRGEEEKATGRSTLDLVGSSLVAVALVGITYALVELPARGLAAVAPFFVVGIAASIGLIVWTLRVGAPVIPPSLLRMPGLAAANLVTLVMYAALGAHLLFLPVYLQFLGFSPTLAGLVFVPPSLGLVLLAPRFGRYADRNGPRVPIAVGAATIGVAVLLLLQVSSRPDAWTWGGASICLVAIGLPAVVAPVTAAALAAAPEDLAGVAAGLNQTVARVGGILSVAAIGALAGWWFIDQGGSGDTPFDPSASGVERGAGVDTFHAIVLCVAGLAFLASALAATFLRGQRQSKTPSSVSSATLRSSPPA